MHLDMIQQGKPKKEYGNKNFNNTKETRKCYNCDKPGHLARDCRMKNKVTRQLNVLTGPKEEDPEEWTVVHEHVGCEKDDITHIGPRHSTEIIQEEEQVLVDTVHPQTSLRQQMIDLVEAFEAAMIDPEKLRAFQKELQGKMFIEVSSPGSESSDDRATTSSPERTPGKDGLAERPATPHPGKKVKGHWDEESDKENRYPEERALTPVELAIYTLPASPKLTR
jgi:hypothetical protein